MTDTDIATTEVVPGVPGELADPFVDADDKSKNRSKVGAIRPNSMLYTAGIGATVDLPHISVMPQGLDAWEKAYDRQGGATLVLVPRLLEAVRGQLGHQVGELRQPPWVPEDEGSPVGIPTRVFPQWLRCTGCEMLAPISANKFEFENRSRHRPDQAKFVHKGCKGKPKKGMKEGIFKGRDRVAVPARYLIACTNGHIDEFPYREWVHRADSNPIECVPNPQLRMVEWTSNLGPSVRLECRQCGAYRDIAELTRAGGADALPNCRGRHPHLPTYQPVDKPCQGEVRLMLLGAANQWFSSNISVLVLPSRKTLTPADVVSEVQGLPPLTFSDVDGLTAIGFWRKFASPAIKEKFDGVPDDLLWQAVQIARGDLPSIGKVSTGSVGYDPNYLLAPEWETLTHPDEFQSEDRKAGFKVRPVAVASSLDSVVNEVVAVDRIRKANAFTGFTRIDALDRVGDEPSRVAPLTQSGKPTWVPATEDRGEGVFLRFDESIVADWESGVLASGVWADHLAAHERNLARRQSKTAVELNADERMPPPRYWALHTLSHLLIREMAMSSGYGSASLSERIYAWSDSDTRGPVAGILITTTSPDSEGTLGGLVDLSRTNRLEEVLHEGLHRARRCSSDPICANRVPKDQEDFLHGAACHFCVFLSETSCEKANRFLDRRFVLSLGSGSFDLEPLLGPIDLDAWHG